MIIEEWGKKLGLLPVPLFALPNRNRVVLLNGNVGNFCLDLECDVSPEDARSCAWSSDVGHYVNLKKGIVEIYKWDKYSPERYKLQSINEKLEKFHQYLEANQPKRESSVIAFMMRTFRQLRSVINEKERGRDSLKAFLYLLACGVDNINQRNRLDFGKWGLDNDARNIITGIREGDWDLLIRSIRQFESYSLKTQFPLILNHASGKLFQEAHYKCLLDPQMFIEGILPPEVVPLRGAKNQSIGVYYTPAALARTLVEEVFASIQLDKENNHIKIFDPACGSGEFLKEVLQNLLIRGYKGKIELIGWDISSIAIDMTKFIVTYMQNKFKKQISLDIKCTDALVKQWPQDVDIVIMNPPFQSWQDMKAEQQEKVRVSLGNLAEKRVDLASAFIWKAAKSLKKGGVLGTVLPVSVLTGESYVCFRNELGEIVSPVLIGKLGSQVIFSNAIVDTAIFVGKKGATVDNPIALWADYKPTSSFAALRALRKRRYLKQEDLSVIDEDNFSIYVNPQIKRGKNNWIPRSYKSFKLFESLSNLPSVKDFFEVHQGARTGLKSAFVLTKDSVESLPAQERKYFCPAILNPSIEKGMIKDIFYVFYPYLHNQQEIATEQDLKSVLPIYYKNILSINKDKLVNRCRKGEGNWWKLSEHGAWQKTKKIKIVSKYFGESGAFALDKNGDYIVVQGYGWLPIESKETLFNLDIWLSYLAILSSRFINDLLPSISNHVGGGQWDLSTRFIRNMPLPSLFLTSFDAKVIKDLSLIGNSILTGKYYDEQQLEDLVKFIYGLS
ncbi:MAG: N-6 DNA methylase [Methanogenium sp.]|jgi:predicted RNA methylase